MPVVIDGERFSDFQSLKLRIEYPGVPSLEECWESRELGLLMYSKLEYQRSLGIPAKDTSMLLGVVLVGGASGSSLSLCRFELVRCRLGGLSGRLGWGTGNHAPTVRLGACGRMIATLGFGDRQRNKILNLVSLTGLKH